MKRILDWTMSWVAVAPPVGLTNTAHLRTSLWSLFLQLITDHWMNEAAHWLVDSMNAWWACDWWIKLAIDRLIDWVAAKMFINTPGVRPWKNHATRSDSHTRSAKIIIAFFTALYPGFMIISRCKKVDECNVEESISKQHTCTDWKIYSAQTSREKLFFNFSNFSPIIHAVSRNGFIEVVSVSGWGAGPVEIQTCRMLSNKFAMRPGEWLCEFATRSHEGFSTWLHFFSYREKWTAIWGHATSTWNWPVGAFVPW